MAAGNVAERANHDRHGEAVGQGNAEKPECVRCVGILIDACGSRAEEDQSKRADEFSREFLRKVVHRGASRRGTSRVRCDREGFSIWNTNANASNTVMAWRELLLRVLI